MYNLDGKDILSIDKISQVTTAGEESDKLSMQVVYTLDTLHIHGQNFGSGKLDIKLSNLDGKAIKQFSDQYHQQVTKIMRQTGTVDPRQQQNRITQYFLQQLPTALRGSPYLIVNSLSWKNSKGESTLTLTLNFNDSTTVQTATQDSVLTPDQQWTKFINKLDVTLTIPLDMASEAAAHFARLWGYEKDAKILAKQQIHGLVAIDQMFRLITVVDNTLTSRFYYADDQFNLNGQKTPLQNFPCLFDMFCLSDGTSQSTQP